MNTEDFAALPGVDHERRLALVIGVDQAPGAQDLRLHQPLSATADAEAIAQILAGEHCQFQLVRPPLLGAEATSGNVRREIFQFGQRATEQDFLLLYFAGHGAITEHGTSLVTYDFQEQEAQVGLHLLMPWLRDSFYFRTAAQKVLIILDCCYAGNFGRTIARPDLPDLFDSLSNELKNVFNPVVSDNSAYRPTTLRYALTSTIYGQVAGETGEHGLMTHALLQALTGSIDRVIDVEQHGNVDLFRVYTYLREAMQASQHALAAVQLPDLPGNPGGKDCVLANFAARANQLRLARTQVVNERPTSHILHRRLPSFQRRPGEDEAVARLLFDASAPSLQGRVIGLVGIGGSGKTRLATELAYDYKDAERFPAGIFWLPVTGSTLAELQHSLAVLGEQTSYLPPGDDPVNPENELARARHMARYLAQHRDALLILDNVDQIEPLLDAFPAFANEGLRCHILYTSRVTDAPSFVGIHPVGGLPEKEALQLLLEHRPDFWQQVQADPQQSEAQAARAICEDVRGLPLALTLLRELLRDPSLTLTYLWEQQRLRGTIAVTGLGGDVLTTKLFHTFEQSWQRITLPHAQQLLIQAVHFPEASPVPLWLLSLLTGLTGETNLEPLGQARRELQRLGLIDFLPDVAAISVHPLIRECGQVPVRHHPPAQSWLAEAGTRLLSEFATIDTFQKRVLTTGYWKCLSDLQGALDYARQAALEQVRVLERIEHWMALDGDLLADTASWTQQMPALFSQQWINHAVEDDLPLSGAPPTTRWIRQLNRVGAGDQLLLRELLHPDEVTSVAFAPDGRFVLTACADGIARLWDGASSRLLQTFEGHTDQMTRAVFSPDGQSIATCSRDETARLWEVASGREIRVVRGHTAAIRSIAFSADGTRVATASEDKTAQLWDTATGEALGYFARHGSMLMDLAFSPDGRQLATCGADGNAFLWDIASEQVVATLLTQCGGLSSIAWSADGQTIAITAWMGVLLWDTTLQRTTNSLATAYQAQGYWITGVDISSDGRFLAVSSRKQMGKKNKAQVWDRQTGKLQATYRHRDVINGIAFAPDGSTVATSSDDHTVRIWHVLAHPTPEVIDPANVEIITAHFSPAGNTLAVTTNNGGVRLWDVRSGEPGLSADLLVEEGWITTIAFVPCSHEVLVILDDTLWTWHTTHDRQEVLGIGNAQTRFASAAGASMVLMGAALAISPDASLIAVGTVDDEAQVWDLRERHLVATLGEHQGLVTSLVFSPDGKRIVTASSEGSAILWDTRTYNRIKVLKSSTGLITGMCPSPEGAYLAIGGLNGTVELWALHDGQLIATLKQHTQRITCLAFSPNGRILLTADLLGQVVLWHIQQPAHAVLAGRFPAPHEIGAAFWQDASHLILADTDGTENRPHFYHLALEGAW